MEKEKIVADCSEVFSYLMQQFSFIMWIVKVKFVYAECYKNSTGKPKFE